MKYALILSVLFAAASAPFAQQAPITRTTTTGVLIDVTVVDGQGRPVLDLRPEEFELEEDGKRQQIAAVSLVHAGVSRAVGGAAAPAAPASPAPTPVQAADATPAANAVPDDGF